MTIGVAAVTVKPPGIAALDITCLIDELTINHGRLDPDTQPEASTATLDLDLEDASLPSEIEIGSVVTIKVTVGGTTYTRFVGKVTDINLGWDDAAEDTPNAGIGQIVAASTLADLGRFVVGDAPFPQELDGARVSRIMGLCGIALSPTTSDPGTVQIIARDIDSQDALSVTTQTVDSAGGVLWQTKLGEVRYADAEHRRSLAVSVTFDACDILVTPVWQRSIQGLINKVSLGYGVPVGGGEQPRASGQSDASIATYGTYFYTSATELAALADAQARVLLLITRNARPAWLMQALPVDMKGLTQALTKTLLSLDMHALIQLDGLPTIVPGSQGTVWLWLEGWTERLAFGVHELSLNVSGFCRSAPPPRWDDVSTTTFDEMTVTFDDSVCLGPIYQTGTWASVPASTRWDTAKGTWDAWAG